MNKTAIKYHEKIIKKLKKFIEDNQNEEVEKGQLFYAREDLKAHELRLKELEGGT